MGAAVAAMEDEQTVGERLIQAPALLRQKDPPQVQGRLGQHIETRDKYKIRIGEMGGQVKVCACCTALNLILRSLPKAVLLHPCTMVHIVIIKREGNLGGFHGR